MTDKELYKELSRLTKNKDEWKDQIPFAASMLEKESVKIQAKALWLLGEMGLAYPVSISGTVPAIASFCRSQEPLLRERAIHALGRIGRSSFRLIEPYWEELFRFAEDDAPAVRRSFIWASENIARTTPDPYEKYMHVFAPLLDDPDDRVRMEAPEIFRVVGKQRPMFVFPFLTDLSIRSKTDENQVVQVHCTGAVNAIYEALRRRSKELHRQEEAEMNRFSVQEMLDMQEKLQERYRDLWKPIGPERGKEQLLWMIGETGEVIDIIKKHGADKACQDPKIRARLVEEMADVLMYYCDVLLCCGISSEELRNTYIIKFRRNMTRW